MSFWANWEDEAAPLYAPQAIAPLGPQKVHLVDKPGAPQSVVMMVRQGMPYDATGDFYLGQLANFNLAGNFNSRINQNLREDKGYTYGAYGYFSGNVETGSVVFTAQVRADSTIASIKEIEKEKKILVNTATGDRLTTCAATSAAFVNGLKAFGVDKDGVFMLPVLKFSYYKL